MTTSDGTIDVERLLAERDWLRRLALRLLGDEQDADDLVQETMRRALERAPCDLERGPLRAWLTTAARRASFYRWRSDAHRRARERAVARTEALPSAEEAVERAATQRLLADSVMALDEPLRSAVALRYFEGLSYADVARRQGVTPVAARKRVSRGIEVLRARLDEGTRGDRAAWTAALAPFADLARRSGGTVEAAALMQAKTKWAAAVAVAAVLGVVGWTAWVGRHAPDGAVDVAARTLADVTPENEEELAELESVEEAGRVEEVAPLAAVETPTAPAARDAFPDRDASVVGTLEVRVSWASDGTAASGVMAKVLPWGEQNAHLWSRRNATDETGTVRFEGVHAGTVGIYLDRGGFGRGEIEAGRTTRVDVEVPRGVDVVGRVLDPRGAPVGGAILELSDYGNNGTGSVIGTAGADGRYRVRDVSDGHDLSARAPGFAPSGQVDINGSPGSTLEVDLVLGGAGGRIVGTVVDENGTRLADATVLVSPSGSRERTQDEAGRRVYERPLPLALRTNADGLFEADGLGAHHHTVQVRTAMHAPLRRSFQVEAGEKHEVLLQMRLGRTLTGVVKRADGEPARGASVSLWGSNLISGHSAKAAPDGSFRIDAIGRSEIEVFAREKDHGKTRAKLHFRNGEPLHWEATLVPGNHATGVLVDEDGEPIAGWFVWACEDRPEMFHRDARADANGRFELKDVPLTAVNLAVGPVDRLSIGYAHVVWNVLPTDEDVRIVVPRSALPGSRITGIVRDASGELSPETSMHFSQKGSRRWRDEHPEPDGRVALTRVYPGTWDAKVKAPGRAPWFGTVDVPVGGVGDLGEVVLGAGGYVQLTTVLREPVEEVPHQVQVERVTASGDLVQYGHAPPEGGQFGPYPEGPVRLRISAWKRATTFVDVVVVRDRTTSAEIALEPGVRWPIRVQWSDSPVERPSEARTHRGESARPDRSLGFRVRDAAGEIVDSFQNVSMPEDVLHVNGLRPGHFLVEVWDFFGQRGSAEFDVAAGLEPPVEPRTTVVLRGDQ
ncbi:MAG: sigma-70 family RNA polymerase sigma factor [Planctomycetota bacterium]